MKTGAERRTYRVPEGGLFDEAGGERHDDVISAGGDVEGTIQRVALVDGNHLIHGGDADQ